MTNFIAITAGGTVSWHNSDTDEHFVDLVYGWSGPINPTEIGPDPIKGTQETPPAGETQPLPSPCLACTTTTAQHTPTSI